MQRLRAPSRRRPDAAVFMARVGARVGLCGLLTIAVPACIDREEPSFGPSSYKPAAAANATSLYALPLDLFGRPETGWAVYAPRVSQTLGATARADTAAFAAAVRRWRAAHGLGRSGLVDGAVLEAMKAQWQAARPYVALRATGVCPPAPQPDKLAELKPGESFGGKAIQLRASALAAYRRLVAEARRMTPSLAARPDLLKVFSGFRSPEYDAARCATDGNCQGVVRAACSAHRTGLAMDLVLDTAPGFAVDDSRDANRLAMANGLAYRWLLANGARFGFVNYAFEPWHWEWTGERP